MTTSSAVSPAQLPGPVTASRRAWLLLLLVVVALMAARLPSVMSTIRRQVDAAIASGELVDTAQRQLAVTIAVSVALALSAGMLLVAISVARRVEGRLRLPVARFTGRSVPGLLLIVGTGLVAKQVASIAVGAQGRPFDPAVLGVVVAAVAVAVTVVVASTERGGPRRRALAAGLAVGLVAAVI